MKKSIGIVLLILILTISMSACGYNRIMREHLSDVDNYTEYQVTVVGIACVDEQGNAHKEYTNEQLASAERVFLDVTFASKAELSPFLGVSEQGIANDPSTYTIRLQINAENHKVLVQNGFYDAVKAGDEITVTASNWIYMDGEFFYVIGVACGEQVYLNPTVGLQNVIGMMKKQRGLL